MLPLFDCEFGVGLTDFGYPVTRTPAEAFAVMDRFGIGSAFVYDRHAHEAGVFDRFDFILEICRQAPPGRLYPAIPVVPPATGEQPPPAELVEWCLANGIRAVRACPNVHNFICDSFSMGKLLEVLEKHRMPLIHTSMRVQDHPWLHEPAWRDLHDVARAFPNLPIIVLYTGMLQGRRLFPLLEQCPNVLADLTCDSFQFVEDVVERFGSGKLVYASHFPTEDPGLYRMPISHGGISEQARDDIAAGNVLKMLRDSREESHEDTKTRRSRRRER